MAADVDWLDSLVTQPKFFCGEAFINAANIRSHPGNPLGAVVVFVPAAGQYTIGVFRMGLVEPAAVEPTVFQLRITTAD